MDNYAPKINIFDTLTKKQFFLKKEHTFVRNATSKSNFGLNKKSYVFSIHRK